MSLTPVDFLCSFCQQQRQGESFEECLEINDNRITSYFDKNTSLNTCSSKATPGADHALALTSADGKVVACGLCIPDFYQQVPGQQFLSAVDTEVKP